MHDSSFWYTYGTVGPRGAREGPGGAQHPLAPLRSAYDMDSSDWAVLVALLQHF